MRNSTKTDPDTHDEPARDDKSPESDTGGSSADVKAPFAPHEEDESPLGDTDQHSDA